MPLMHAEDRDVAERSVRVYAELSEEVKKQGREGDPDNLSHAVAHADIVRRFGRYPHRNALLGRATTPEETAFLASDGRSFGQGKG
jgi:uncharacterized protein (DUF924 family)